MNFDVDKIVNWLNQFKSDLPSLYRWDPNIDKLVDLETLTLQDLESFKSLSGYEKEIRLKTIIGSKLNETKGINGALFDKLCLWIIKDWGRISSNSDTETLRLLKEFFTKDKPSFHRIASLSKVGAYLYPHKNVIYDSRVAYTLNWIILSEGAGERYFPISAGRNSKMAALDLNVLIRLKNIDVYQPSDIKELDHKRFINNIDKKIFIDKSEAYFELNHLLLQVNQKLWQGDPEKERNLYYTEMLLFSIADREVFKDITEKYKSCPKLMPDAITMHS